jgi:hypothetical protein
VPLANHQRIVLRHQCFGSSRQQMDAELRKRTPPFRLWNGGAGSAGKLKAIMQA